MENSSPSMKLPVGGSGGEFVSSIEAPSEDEDPSEEEKFESHQSRVN